MNGVTVLRIAAGALTTVAFVPQVVKAWRTRSTRDVSLGMFLTLCAGILLWLLYGFLVGDLPLILANGVTLGLATTILILKLRYK
jgi:MtN3 and saliva related transmembrane protein